jgi:ABC-2 type transport system ATP-binding protein
VLLGDPEVLILDEPVNGLDPEGIRWIRDLLRDLAKEGRTVLVSSHLLSEMALIAEELVVIGQGKLITQCTVGEFTARYAKQWVRVVSPQVDALKPLAVARGATMSEENGAINFHGMTAAELGELGATAGVTFHELSPQTGSLEDAFLDATASSVQYHGGKVNSSSCALCVPLLQQPLFSSRFLLLSRYFQRCSQKVLVKQWS